MLGYAIGKYIAYSAWCWIGVRLLVQREKSIPLAMFYGVMLWMLGFFLGAIVFLTIGTTSHENLALRYVAIYTPLRIIEWGLIATLIVRHAHLAWLPKTMRRSIGWIVGGIAVSFATDLLSPEGLAGRFCVGRCLC